MTVSTREFESAHKKMPGGYGWWWFRCKIEDGWEEIQFPGYYSEAKRRAIRWCKQIGGSELAVLP